MSHSKDTARSIVPPLDLPNDSPDSSDDERVNENQGVNLNPNNANYQHDQQNRDDSPESGIDLASRDTTGMTENRESTMVSETTDRTVLPPNQLFNFDLTNPEEVVKMLETVDLTDEDTDVLLQEAYNVNMKLKEILRRQEQSGGNLSQHDAAALHESNIVVVPGAGPSKGSAANSRANSASKRSQFAKNAPLPPISNGSTPNSNIRIPSAVYSAKLSRPVPPSASKRPSMSSQDRRMVSRNPSAATMHKPPKSTKKTVPVAVEKRAEWNDRFMY